VTPPGDLVPVRDARVVPTHPTWRLQVERATKVAVGAAGALTRRDAAGDESNLAAAGDAALGAALAGEQVLLDLTEHAVNAGASLARATARVPFVRGALNRAARAVEPLRVRGEQARVVAVRDVGASLPQYVSAAADSALDLVSLDDVLDRIDVEAIIERVDVQRIIERVDIGTILERVDIQSIIDRVDVNEIVARMDLDALVSDTDLGAIIAQSTGGMASTAVDLVRRQGVGLDGFVARWARRVNPRLRDAPSGPPLLMASPESEGGPA